jgi:hypothetical protein
MFVKEVLLDNSRANAQAVNEAWQAAGMEGSISGTLVSQVRSRMGLVGNLRGRRRKRTKADITANEGPGRGGPSRQATSESNGPIAVKTRGRKTALTDLEVDLDRLLFKVMEVGDLADVENALRSVRRRLYAAWAPES